MLFLSYASPDRARVETYYDALEQMGFRPWMDSRMLRVGQNWDFEIQRALDQAKIVVLFLSNNSVDRRGYVQREIKISLRKLEEKLIDDVYIIPVALDDVVRPPELSRIQFVDAKSPDCLEDMRLSISDQLKKLGEAELRETEIDGVKYARRKYSDSYDGIPGYEINADFVALKSDEYANINNANDLISGEIARSIMNSRSCALVPDNELYNIGQARWSRTNTLDWVLGEVVNSGRILSVVYTVHHYGAGAAHPVSGFKTFNFFLSPLIEISSFKDIIEDNACLEVIQTEARTQLSETLRAMIDGEPDENWIIEGTSDWDCFRSFSIHEGKISFHFGSYQVAAYVFGHQSVTIPVKKIAAYLTDFAANSLDVGWVKSQQT